MSDAAKRAEIGLCLMLAAADGVVSEAEIGALSSRLGALLGDGVGDVDFASALQGEMGALDELGPDGYTATLVERLPQAARMSALRAALSVAFADGLAPEEESTFRDVSGALGVDRLEADAMLERASLMRSVKPRAR